LELAQNKYQLPKVFAITNLDNTLSIRVLEKLGFAFERFINLPGEAQALKLFGCDWGAGSK
jgi:RimJ/RimL family protein N-acetyltransferase